MLLHPWVLAELILGGLSSREQRLLERLPKAPVVAQTEVIEFVHLQRLARRKVGWVDVNLLASARVAPALLWTLNASLQAGARTLRVAVPR